MFVKQRDLGDCSSYSLGPAGGGAGAGRSGTGIWKHTVVPICHPNVPSPPIQRSSSRRFSPCLGGGDAGSSSRWHSAQRGCSPPASLYGSAQGRCPSACFWAGSRTTPKIQATARRCGCLPAWAAVDLSRAWRQQTAGAHRIYQISALRCAQ